MSSSEPCRQETFQWEYHLFNVTRINADVGAGTLKGYVVIARRPTIVWYSEKVLGVLTPEERLFPQFSLVNVTYAKSLTAPRTEQPVIFVRLPSMPAYADDLSAGLCVPGVLCLDPTGREVLRPDIGITGYVIAIDGNHRIASAYFSEKQSVQGMVLSMDQLRREHFAF